MWKPPMDLASVAQMPLHPHLLAADSMPLNNMSVSFPAPSVERVPIKSSKANALSRSKKKDKAKLKIQNLSSRSAVEFSKNLSKFSSLSDEEKARNPECVQGLNEYGILGLEEYRVDGVSCVYTHM